MPFKIPSYSGSTLISPPSHETPTPDTPQPLIPGGVPQQTPLTAAAAVCGTCEGVSCGAVRLETVSMPPSGASAPGVGPSDGDTEDEADGEQDDGRAVLSGQIAAAADDPKTRKGQISWKFPPTTRAFLNSYDE
jgi:hypothetical protein